MATIKTLRYFLRDALAAYTDDLIILSGNNPISLSLNGAKYSVHVLLITDSGENRHNADEQRIQITKKARDKQKAKLSEIITPLFLGFFPDGKVFTAWEPAYPFSLMAKNGSVYARLSHHDIALDEGSAVYRMKPKYLARKSSTLSLPSEQLGFYMENWKALHSATDASQLAAALLGTSRALNRGRLSANVKLGKTRKRVSVTRTAFPRNPEFTREVLEAYDHSCCICAKQLGLVQAAHIIPHSHDDSSDDVTNGVALCVEHHRLYDDGLILVEAKGVIKINPDRVEHLQNIEQDEGLDAIENLNGLQIRMPDDADSHPNDDFLTRGVGIRMGEGN